MRAQDDMQDGFPLRNGEPLGVMSSDISDVTSRLALGEPDEIEIMAKRLAHHLSEAKRHLKLATYDVQKLCGLTPEEARRISDALEQKVRQCVNCACIVANNRDDRLVSGRCKTCYEYKRRNSVDRQVPPELGSHKMYGTINPITGKTWAPAR